jgi:hypothetical protein
MQHLKTIERLVRRVRWRLKAQSALRALTYAAFAAALVGVGGVVAFKLRAFGAAGLDVITVVALGLLALGVLVGLARRVRDVDAAQRLDRVGGFKDRLGSALAFARAPARTPLMEAAIADAEQVVGRARPRLAAPLEVPVRLAGVVVIATGIIAALLLVVEVPIAQGEAAGVARVQGQALGGRKRTTLRPEDRKRLAEQAEELEEALAKADDPAVKRWIEKLNQLIRDLQAGKLTAKEAYAKMAELDKAKQQWEEEVGDGVEAAKRQLAKAADKETRPSKQLDAMMKALQARELDKAAQELDKVAKEVEQGKMKAPDRRSLGKDLKTVAAALQTERQKREEEARSKRDELRKKRRRLQKKNPKADLSEGDKRRLQRQERELERLRRERQEMSEARRTLEKLQSQMDKAAQDLLRRLQQQQQQAGGQQGAGQQQQMTADQLRKAAEMMRRLSEAAKSGKTFRIAQGKIVDMKEMMRRAGQGKDGQGKDGDGKDGKLDKFTKLAQGQGDKPGQEGKDGQSGAGQSGKGDGKDPQVFEMGKGEGKKGDLMMLGGDGEGPSLGGPPGPPQAKAPGAGNTEGEGAGDGHDSNMLGAKKRLDGVRHKEDLVMGKQGAGESQSRVVFAAAKRGFATRAYKQVHQDYSGVVEETLDRQEIPAGSRRYVRRYFDLIRPR